VSKTRKLLRYREKFGNICFVLNLNILKREFIKEFYDAEHKEDDFGTCVHRFMLKNE
jgi:hypothetical protein